MTDRGGPVSCEQAVGPGAMTPPRVLLDPLDQRRPGGDPDPGAVTLGFPDGGAPMDERNGKLIPRRGVLLARSDYH